MSEDPQSELKPGSSTPELSEAQEEESKAKDETTPNDEDMKDEDEEDEEAKKKKQEELRKKYADWPLKGIKDPHDNDVMYGRGGGTNHHPGNKNYRKMVEDRKLEYVNSKRLDKPLVALEIIRLWRAQVPPGRFLKLDDKTGLWHDVGDKKAREKTSQALREKAPLIRKQQEEDGEEVRFTQAIALLFIDVRVKPFSQTNASRGNLGKWGFKDDALCRGNQKGRRWCK